MRTTTHAVTSLVKATTGTALLAASAMHVAWGLGSTFPYATLDELTDNVVGAPSAPSPRACYAVATGLAAGAALVTMPNCGRSHSAALRVLAMVFVVRSAFGFVGRTDLLVQGSSSSAFRQNDRTKFSPACALLAAGVVVSARRPTCR